jgi:hypothetical protein
VNEPPRVIEATLLRPLPGVESPERWVVLAENRFSVPDFQDLRAGGAAG